MPFFIINLFVCFCRFYTLFLGLLGLLPGLISRVLQHSLDNLLLLNQKCSHNSFLDTVSTDRATIRPLDSLLGSGNGGIFSGSQGRDTRQSSTALTTLWSSAALLDMEIAQLSTGSLDDLDSVTSSVVWLGAPFKTRASSVSPFITHTRISSSITESLGHR